MGRPRRMDMDLSATRIFHKQRAHRKAVCFGLTLEKQPKSASAYFRFNGIQALIRGFLVHMESDSDVCSFTERSMRGGVVTLAEMIYSIALKKAKDQQ